MLVIVTDPGAGRGDEGAEERGGRERLLPLHGACLVRRGRGRRVFRPGHDGLAPAVAAGGGAWGRESLPRHEGAVGCRAGVRLRHHGRTNRVTPLPLLRALLHLSLYSSILFSSIRFHLQTLIVSYSP
jgi:hypothetical protein